MEHYLATKAGEVVAGGEDALDRVVRYEPGDEGLYSMWRVDGWHIDTGDGRGWRAITTTEADEVRKYDSYTRFKCHTDEEFKRYYQLQTEVYKLKRHIGKEVYVVVHVTSGTWDYGDVEWSEDDVDYYMTLTGITEKDIRGVLTREEEWKHKGEPITQPFIIDGSRASGLPWDAGTTKEVTLIRHGDEVLYKR